MCCQMWGFSEFWSTDIILLTGIHARSLSSTSWTEYCRARRTFLQKGISFFRVVSAKNFCEYLHEVVARILPECPLYTYWKPPVEKHKSVISANWLMIRWTFRIKHFEGSFFPLWHPSFLPSPRECARLDYLWMQRPFSPDPSAWRMNWMCTMSVLFSSCDLHLGLGGRQNCWPSVQIGFTGPSCKCSWQNRSQNFQQLREVSDKLLVAMLFRVSILVYDQTQVNIFTFWGFQRFPPRYPLQAGHRPPHE